MINSRNRNLSYLDAFFFALMVGAGETYFTAYSLFIGHSDLQAGLLMTAPLAIGGIFQLITPLLLNKMRNYKLWIAICAFLQLTVFILPISFDHMPYLLFFFFVCIYWSAFFSASSVWNSWMAKLISKDDYSLFFTKRSTLMYLGILLGLAGTGICLEYKVSYLFIFVLCIFFRLFSLTFILLIDDKGVSFQNMRGISLNVLKDFSTYTEVRRLGVFTLFFKFSVYVSASFFTPYMLEILGFSYLEFMIILAMSFIGRILIMRVFRRAVSEIQMQKYFVLSCIGLCFIPFMWVFTSSFSTLFVLEIFTGVFWGVFEIVFLLNVFQKLSPEDNAGFMISFNLLNSVAIGMGTLLGACLFQYFPREEIIKNYVLVLSSSSLLRLVSIFFIPNINLKKVTVKILPFMRPVGPRINVGIGERASWRLFKNKEKKKKPN